MPSPSKIQVKTLRVRIKDRHAKALRELASEVNLVWNFSQDLALKGLEREPRFMSAFDMAPFTQGASKEGLNLHSQTVQAVSEEYCRRRASSRRESCVGEFRAEPGVLWAGSRSRRRRSETQADRSVTEA